METDHYRLGCCGRELDLRTKPRIMAILNTTPDSFFDGGRLGGNDSSTVDVDHAVEIALGMIGNGAEIVDIGGESTRPGAEAVGAAEEIRRTAPVIRELRRASDVIISIDTYKAVVAEEALKAGASIVNDISGFRFDPDIAPVCARHKAAVILMHSRNQPGKMGWSYQTGSSGKDILSIVHRTLLDAIRQAEQHGIGDIVLDPGFGFGKSVGENFALLRRLPELLDLERPLLAGLSRKSFLGAAIRKTGEPLPAPQERLAATVAANTVAIMNGASIIRVHDTKEAVHAAAVASAVLRTGRDEGRGF
ncbi:dihydropteroate synthase [Prosthecochloris sp. GSB1]|nr:dihydropteroate synthase [Prosthecochloris sp. GSB1]